MGITKVMGCLLILFDIDCLCHESTTRRNPAGHPGNADPSNPGPRTGNAWLRNRRFNPAAVGRGASGGRGFALSSTSENACKGLDRRGFGQDPRESAGPVLPADRRGPEATGSGDEPLRASGAGDRSCAETGRGGLIKCGNYGEGSNIWPTGISTRWN